MPVPGNRKNEIRMGFPEIPELVGEKHVERLHESL